MTNYNEKKSTKKETMEGLRYDEHEYALGQAGIAALHKRLDAVTDDQIKEIVTELALKAPDDVTLRAIRYDAKMIYLGEYEATVENILKAYKGE